MKSLACGFLLTAFLLMSAPSFPAAFTGPTTSIVYVMDTPATPRHRRRRNHYSGRNF